MQLMSQSMLCSNGYIPKKYKRLSRGGRLRGAGCASPQTRSCPPSSLVSPKRGGGVCRGGSRNILWWEGFPWMKIKLQSFKVANLQSLKLSKCRSFKCSECLRFKLSRVYQTDLHDLPAPFFQQQRNYIIYIYIYIYSQNADISPNHINPKC